MSPSLSWHSPPSPFPSSPPFSPPSLLPPVLPPLSCCVSVCGGKISWLWRPSMLLTILPSTPLLSTSLTNTRLAILPAYIAPKCLMVICKYSRNTDGVNKLYGIETADPVLSSLDTGDMWYRNSKMSSTKCHPSLIINILIDCRKHYLPCSTQRPWVRFWGPKNVASSCTHLGPAQVMEVIIIDV